ncbi:MAG: LicD family protein [Lachnospiraceae bacterium]|nr:LicD family protein [Lachnospiraceae bacterium]
MDRNLDIRLKIPDDFFEEETKCDYVVSRKMKEIWAVELDLLNELLKVCKKYNLKIYADGGTTLGALRHKGYIPWDDDIDMVMLRDDYKRLCEVAESEFSEPYFFQTEQTDEGSLRGHAQLRNSNTTGALEKEADRKLSFNQGIFIDIFPLDAIPDDDDEKDIYFDELVKAKEKYWKFARWTSRVRDSKNIVKRIIKYCIGSVLKLFIKKNIFFDRFEILEDKYNSTRTKRIGKLCFSPIPEKRIWKRSWFDDVEWMPFEMLEIPVPIGHDEMMDTFFGDWRTPKKVSSTHGGVIFDVHKSYKEFFEDRR